MPKKFPLVDKTIDKEILNLLLENPNKKNEFDKKKITCNLIKKFEARIKNEDCRTCAKTKTQKCPRKVRGRWESKVYRRIKSDTNSLVNQGLLKEVEVPVKRRKYKGDKTLMPKSKWKKTFYLNSDLRTALKLFDLFEKEPEKITRTPWMQIQLNRDSEIRGRVENNLKRLFEAGIEDPGDINVQLLKEIYSNPYPISFLAPGVFKELLLDPDEDEHEFIPYPTYLASKILLNYGTVIKNKDDVRLLFFYEGTFETILNSFRIRDSMSVPNVIKNRFRKYLERLAIEYGVLRFQKLLGVIYNPILATVEDSKHCHKCEIKKICESPLCTYFTFKEGEMVSIEEFKPIPLLKRLRVKLRPKDEYIREIKSRRKDRVQKHIDSKDKNTCPKCKSPLISFSEFKKKYKNDIEFYSQLIQALSAYENRQVIESLPTASLRLI